MERGCGDNSVVYVRVQALLLPMSDSRAAGAFFTTYEGIKHLLNSSDDHHESKKNALLPTPMAHAIASSVAECVSCFILTPAEVLKQNAQMITSGSGSNPADTRRRSATLTVLSHFRSRPLQLWRGYGALVARNLPFTAIQFPLFEHLRDRITAVYRPQPERQSDAAEMLNRAGITALSAGLAGAVAALVTTPIDVVKTRIMLEAGKRGARPGAIAVGRDIYAREGFRALFSGGILRAGWTALGIGLYLSAYESGRMYLEARRKRLDAVAVGGRREGQPVI